MENDVGATGGNYGYRAWVYPVGQRGVSSQMREDGLARESVSSHLAMGGG